MRSLRMMAVAAVLVVAGAAKGQQSQDGFRVTLTTESVWLSYCRLDIDAGGQPTAISAPINAQVDCKGLAKEPLSEAEAQRFTKLMANPDVWKGPATGTDPRGSDADFSRLELKSAHVWTMFVTSGNPSFAGGFRKDFLDLLRGIRERLLDRSRANRTPQVSAPQSSPQSESGIDGAWLLSADVVGSAGSPTVLGLKKDGSAAIGYLMYRANPVPITGGKVDGNTVTFKVREDRYGEIGFVGKLEGNRLTLIRDVQNGESSTSSTFPYPFYGVRGAVAYARTLTGSRSRPFGY